jgi:hypothetical protein
VEALSVSAPDTAATVSDEQGLTLVAREHASHVESGHARLLSACAMSIRDKRKAPFPGLLNSGGRI